MASLMEWAALIGPCSRSGSSGVEISSYLILDPPPCLCCTRFLYEEQAWVGGVRCTRYWSWWTERKKRVTKRCESGCCETRSLPLTTTMANNATTCAFRMIDSTSIHTDSALVPHGRHWSTRASPTMRFHPSRLGSTCRRWTRS